MTNAEILLNKLLRMHAVIALFEPRVELIVKVETTEYGKLKVETFSDWKFKNHALQDYLETLSKLQDAKMESCHKAVDNLKTWRYSRFYSFYA